MAIFQLTAKLKRMKIQSNLKEINQSSWINRNNQQVSLEMFIIPSRAISRKVRIVLNSNRNRCYNRKKRTMIQGIRHNSKESSRDWVSSSVMNGIESHKRRKHSLKKRKTLLKALIVLLRAAVFQKREHTASNLNFL